MSQYFHSGPEENYSLKTKAAHQFTCKNNAAQLKTISQYSRSQQMSYYAFDVNNVNVVVE